MPNNKKSSKKKQSKAQKNLNAENVDRLKRLAEALASLDDKGNTQIGTNNNNQESNIGLSLNHWRDLDEETKHAYKMIHDGAELIKATSTKYTLVGKINVDDGSMFSEELRQGCELISTAALIVHQPSIGCSRPLRTKFKHHARATILSVITLIESFQTLMAMDGNTGAINTGVVWSQCDDILTKLPKGNRAAMRREIFTWVGDCNETMEEFEEIIKLGTFVQENDGATDSNEFVEREQYNDKEIEIAKSCLAIIKCSRGILGLLMKACECAGKYQVSHVTQGEEDVSKDIFQWISNAHELSRVVGEKVTDIGMSLYPPLNLGWSDDDADQVNIEERWIKTELGQQILQQSAALKAAANYVQDHIISVQNQSFSLEMSDEVMELGSKLLAAIDLRTTEAKNAISNAIETTLEN